MTLWAWAAHLAPHNLVIFACLRIAHIIVKLTNECLSVCTPAFLFSSTMKMQENALKVTCQTCQTNPSFCGRSRENRASDRSRTDGLDTRKCTWCVNLWSYFRECQSSNQQSSRPLPRYRSFSKISRKCEHVVANSEPTILWISCLWRDIRLNYLWTFNSITLQNYL